MSFKEFNSLVLSIANNLHAVGAQNDLDIPRIVVIGNQSAGKSSVVEAISGISVPRDAGTCTRCPMELRLKEDKGPWQAQVFIRREYGTDKRRLQEIKEQPFGPPVKNKTQLEDVLRRAQLAVLNPLLRFPTALNDTLHENSSNSFSRDVVCMDITGPGLPDLSFIDLPGIVQNADTPTVNLVEDMVTSYIQGSSLILVALPMTDDIENQKALKLAHSADPAGARTIGVLTKADLLGDGSIKAKQRWLNIIEGNLHQLKQGYFCTRQPDDADRDEHKSPEQAREAEAKFFLNTAPWNTSSARDRFGIEKLRDALSEKLIDAIERSLPKIIHDVAIQKKEAQDQLDLLPKELSGDPSIFIIDIVTQFSNKVNEYIRGSPEFPSMIQGNAAAFRTFKEAIQRTEPVFNPTSERNPFTLGQSKGMDLIDVREHINKSVTRELPRNVPYPAKTLLIIRFQDAWKLAAQICVDAVLQNVLNIVLSCLKRPEITRFKSLYDFLVSSLTEITKDCFQKARPFFNHELERELVPYTQTTDNLEKATEEWFTKYKGMRAEALKTPQAARIPQPIPNPNASNVSFSAPTAFNFARAQPSSSSASPSNSVPTVANASPAPNSPASPFGAQRVVPIWDRPQSDKPAEKVNELLAKLAELGYTGLKVGDLDRLRSVDEYEEELKVMAEVRGYFQVSYNRVIDTLPTTVDLRFVKVLGRVLQSRLFAKFGLGSDKANKICGAYLVEEPAVATKRWELTTKIARLEKAQDELRRFRSH